MKLIKAVMIQKSYAGFQALKNVSFEVNEGETFAIIGPNGAGKTTLFKVITGEVSGDSGQVFLGERDITRVPAEMRVQLGIGRTFQVARVFPDFSPLENLIVAIEARNRSRGRISNLPRARPLSEVTDEAHVRLHHLGLAPLSATIAGQLSLGDKKRLELALALAMEPKVLMLDEPTAGMSPSDRFAIVELIQQAKSELGLTLILTEHDMDFVFRLSQTVMVMNQGEKILVGSPADIKSSEMVQQIYLGKEMVDA